MKSLKKLYRKLVAATVAKKASSAAAKLCRAASAGLGLEGLEARQLLSGWTASAKLMGQDLLAQNYPSINGSGQTIAVIDTGVDYNHPALGGGWGNKVIAGWNFNANNGDPFPSDFAHGTGTAAIAAANGYYDDSGNYDQGIASGAKIVALREYGVYNGFKNALDWVIANKAKYNIVAVAGIDWGGGGDSYLPELQQLDSMGVIVTSPAGNSAAWDSPNPYGNCVNVGSSTLWDSLSSFSGRGSGVDLLAPGDGVDVPYYDTGSGQHTIASNCWGTSWSSPVVAGAAALIKQVNAGFNAEQIVQILKQSGQPVYDASTNKTYYRVNVYNAVQLAMQWSGQSTAATAAPAASRPTTTATSGSGTATSIPNGPFGMGGYVDSAGNVELGWHSNSDNETGFIVARSTNGGAYSTVATLAANSTSYTDTSVAPGTSYSYCVYAYNNKGNSGADYVSGLTTPGQAASTTTQSTTTTTNNAGGNATSIPNGPFGTSATANSANSVTIAWHSNSDNESGFAVQRSSDGGAWATVGSVNAGVTSYTDSSASGGSTYTYRVYAFNNKGNSGSDYAQVTTPQGGAATATTTTNNNNTNNNGGGNASSVPNGPFGLSAFATSGSSVALAWHDNSDNEDGFVFTRSVNGGAFAFLGTVGANTTSVSDTSVSSGNSYAYRIYAYNSKGWSSFTDASAWVG